LIAFVNPAAVRVFMDALNIWGRRAGEVIKSAEVACVGPATAAEAHRLGLKVDIISSGSQSDLLGDFESRLGK
jgi:uroporphyrinogen-III synthase